MTRTLKNLRSIPAPLLPVIIANFLVAISVSMTFSISPIFITTILGLSVFSMGAMEGFTEALSQLSRPISGLIGDFTKKKKPTLLFGIFLCALSKPFFILANGTAFIMISKVMERLSNGIISTPRDAFVADCADKENIGASYGVMMTAKTLGAILGPFLVSILMSFVQDLRSVLWISFIPSLLAVAIILFSMKESEAKNHAENQQSKQAQFSFQQIKDLPQKYWTLLLLSSLFMLARFSDGFLSLRLQELNAPSSITFATIGIFNAISFLCSYPIGLLSDRIDRWKLLVFSFLALFLSHFFLYSAENYYVGLIGILFWGAQRGTSQILFTAIVAEVAPISVMGTAIGLNNAVTGALSLLASFLGGTMGNHSLQGAFLFGSITSMVALIALLLTLRVKRHRV